MSQRQAATSGNPEVISEGLTSDGLIQMMMVARYVHSWGLPYRAHTIEYIRLLALSSQENEISINTWQRAKQLEAARKTRTL